MKGPILFLVMLALGVASGAILATPPRAPDLGLARSSFAPGPDADGETAPMRSQDVREDETLRAAVAACAPVGGCASALGQPSQYVRIGNAYGATAVDLLVTWTPTSPSTQQLQVSLHACASSCSWPHPALAIVTSGAPLSLRVALEGPEATRDADLFLEVTTPDRAPVGLGAHVRPTSQPFHVGGTVAYS